MSEQKSSPNKWLYILIIFLIMISTAQAFILIQQHNRQNRLEQQPAIRTMLSNSEEKNSKPALPSALYRSRSYPQNFFGEDPWEQFDAMTRQMNSLMRHAFTFGSPLIQSQDQRQGFEYTPAIDLEETADTYIVKSDLPGLQKDKINLTVRDNILNIEGVRETTSEKKDPAAGFYAQERSYGSFARSLALPGSIEESKVKAEYENGVLVITLPKAKPTKSSQKVMIS